MKSSTVPWLPRLAATLLFLFTSLLQAAEEAPDPTVKLREQLRAVMLQLRTSQTESANAQAEKIAAEQKFAALEEESKTLRAANTKLNKQLLADKAAADKTAAEFQVKLADSDEMIVKYKQVLGQTKEAYQKAAEVARTREEQRAKLADQAIVDQRDIADLRRKNIALFNTANEILDRYESYSLGKALSAREPFIGTTRVKVENLVQGYKDKILDNRIAAPAAK
ncbi:MAG: phage major capsid protein [Verrucomicrobiota bacterium]